MLARRLPAQLPGRPAQFAADELVELLEVSDADLVGDRLDGQCRALQQVSGAQGALRAHVAQRCDAQVLAEQPQRVATVDDWLANRPEHMA